MTHTKYTVAGHQPAVRIARLADLRSRLRTDGAVMSGLINYAADYFT